MSAASLGPLGPLLAGGTPPSLNSTYGAVLIGTFFGLILYGLALHQAYRYSRLNFADSLRTKCYVILILGLDTFHVILCMHMCYYYLVSHYLQPLVLFTRVWSIDNLGLIAGLDIIACQCFYAHRVWLIGPKFRPVVVVAIVFFLGELACCIYATVKASILPSYSEFRELTWLFSIAFGLVVVSDILLTTVLIVLLRRSRTGFARTDSMLDVLIAYTISTGLLTDIFSALSFIFPLVYLNTDSMVYIALDIVVTKMYVNSVLGTLNFRKTLEKYQQNTSLMNRDIGLSALARSPVTRSGPQFASSEGSSGTHQTVIDIKVTRELVEDHSASLTDASVKEYGTDLNA